MKPKDKNVKSTTGIETKRVTRDIKPNKAQEAGGRRAIGDISRVTCFVGHCK